MIDEGLRDVLHVLADAPAVPTMMLWHLTKPHGECSRCKDPGQWIAAIPASDDDDGYTGIANFISCDPCLRRLIDSVTDENATGMVTTTVDWPVI